MAGQVIGIAVFRRQKLLIVRRAAADYLGGNFELPGGKVSLNEPSAAATSRELFEETSLVIESILKWFDGFTYQIKNATYRQRNCLVKVLAGPVRLNPKEHDTFKWIYPSQLSRVKMTPQMETCIKLAFKTYEKI